MLTDCVLANNRTANNGGGVYNHVGVLTVTNCTFTGNSASYWGGGVADYYGAADSGEQHLRRQQCRLLGRRLFLNYGLHTVANSTFSANSAGNSGGGIAVLNGALAATNSTFAGNGANSGGAVHNYGGTLTLRNTILTHSTSGGNCAGTITNGGSNIDSNATCGFGAANGSQSNSDPLLGPLADNGPAAGAGPATWTHAAAWLARHRCRQPCHLCRCACSES